MLHETIEQLLPPYRNTYISCEKKKHTPFFDHTSLQYKTC